MLEKKSQVRSDLKGTSVWPGAEGPAVNRWRKTMRESLTALGGTIGALRARPARPLALIAQIYLHAAQRDMDATSGTVVVVALKRCRR